MVMLWSVANITPAGTAAAIDTAENDKPNTVPIIASGRRVNFICISNRLLRDLVMFFSRFMSIGYQQRLAITIPKIKIQFSFIKK